MDLLHELVYVVELKPSRSFSLLLPESSKLRSLYQLVRDDEYLTDEKAAAALYQCAPSDKRYLMLKRNLTSKLSELILISELGDPETTSVKFYLEQRLTVAEKLLLQNVYHNAEKIGKKVRKRAQREGLTEVHLRALQLLRRVYALKGDPRNFQIIADEFLTVQQQMKEEERTLLFLQEIESQIKYTVATLPQVALAITRHQQTHPLGEEVSKFARFQRYKLQIYEAHHQHNLLALDQPLQNMRALIESHSNLQTPANELFWINYRIRHALSLGRFASAEEFLCRARSLTSFQAFDRFEVEEQWYLFHMRKLQLPEAAEVIESVLNCPQYDRLHELDQNLWYVRASYLYWTAKLIPPAVPIHCLDRRFKDLTLEELYKHVAGISRDKTGGNMHIMLIRGLIALTHGEAPDHAFDVGNNLVVYHQRYIRDLPEERMSLFFRSIAKLLKRRQDPEKVIRLHEKLMEGLEASPYSYDLNEWIPFTSIWAALLETQLTGKT